MQENDFLDLNRASSTIILEIVSRTLSQYKQSGQKKVLDRFKFSSIKNAKLKIKQLQSFYETLQASNTKHLDSAQVVQLLTLYCVQDSEGKENARLQESLLEGRQQFIGKAAYDECITKELIQRMVTWLSEHGCLEQSLIRELYLTSVKFFLEPFLLEWSVQSYKETIKYLQSIFNQLAALDKERDKTSFLQPGILKKIISMIITEESLCKTEGRFFNGLIEENKKIWLHPNGVDLLNHLLDYPNLFKVLESEGANSFIQYLVTSNQLSLLHQLVQHPYPVEMFSWFSFLTSIDMQGDANPFREEILDVDNAQQTKIKFTILKDVIDLTQTDETPVPAEEKKRLFLSLFDINCQTSQPLEALKTLIRLLGRSNDEDVLDPIDYIDDPIKCIDPNVYQDKSLLQKSNCEAIIKSLDSNICDKEPSLGGFNCKEIIELIESNVYHYEPLIEFFNDNTDYFREEIAMSHQDLLLCLRQKRVFRELFAEPVLFQHLIQVGKQNKNSIEQFSEIQNIIDRLQKEMKQLREQLGSDFNAIHFEHLPLIKELSEKQVNTALLDEMPASASKVTSPWYRF